MTTCELYLAPSTIPNAGLGIFTGVERQKGDFVGSGDVCIPILDLEWHAAGDPSFVNPFADYVWFGDALGMAQEVSEFESATAYWPGLDAAVNCHAALVNLDRAFPDYDDTPLHRSKDPSAGSFSLYHNGSSLVTHSIPKGGELFKNYGDDWFYQRTEYTGPVVSDYQKAQRLLQEFSWRIPKQVQETVYSLILDIRAVWNKHDNTNDPRHHHARLLQALPNDSYNLTTITTKQDGLRSFHQPNATRSVEWLQEHGTCVDPIIVPGPSTIPGAGRGAFSKRKLRKDSILTISPMIHMLNRSILDMHQIGPGGANGKEYSKQEKIGEQMVRNYCLGHRTTSMLLCPYGAGVNYINHSPSSSSLSSSSSSSSQAANLRLEWASHGTLNHDDAWLTKPLSEWGDDRKDDDDLVSTPINLAVQYIATRDIDPGEELFLDYGDAWERAWQRHVVHYWKQLASSATLQTLFADHVSAVAWNAQHKHTDVLGTDDEYLQSKKDPYPATLQLRCHGGLLHVSRHWNFFRLTWDGVPNGQNSEYGHSCRVVARYEKEEAIMGQSILYDVEMTVVEDYTSGRTSQVELHNVPRNALRWFDKPHTTDMHLHMAFRHEVGLPDAMLPAAWKNIEPSPQEEEEEGEEEEEEEGEEEEEYCPNNNSDAITTEDTTEDTCGLYIAESTIPNAGLGIFAGRAFEIGEEVGNGDVAIPLIEFPWHNGYMTSDVENYFDPTVNYRWDAKAMGMGNDVEISVYWPGINCAVNCYSCLINLDYNDPTYDEAGVHRSKHSGAGAFTPYHLGISKASRRIPAGAELFKDYGESWFTSRAAFDGIPVESNFEEAGDLVDAFFQLQNPSDDLYNYILDLRGVWKSRTLNALPNNLDEAIVAYEGEIADLHQPNMTRDVSWLEQNGRCFDHIVPGQSTLENAAHGAFAKRVLQKGTIISGSPLHHMFRSLLDMYDFEHSDAERKWQRTQKKGEQLLLNYCYGNSKSNLLLCPYGAGVNYINHNQTLANVKIQWAQNATTAHDATWFSMLPKEMEYIYKTNLAFDFVATKAIAQGEEIFLDYGDDWEEAWLEHCKKWEPLEEWASYVSAPSWNEYTANKPLRTEEEQKEEPYQENLSVQCHTVLATESSWDIEDFDWDVDTIDYGFSCRILTRHEIEGGFTYGVLLNVTDEEGYNIKYVERKEVPREAIRFFDRPYTKDLHLRSAFRHEIGIPEDMIPEAWRDREPADARIQ
jgi:hypothetical protein